MLSKGPQLVMNPSAPWYTLSSMRRQWTEAFMYNTSPSSITGKKVVIHIYFPPASVSMCVYVCYSLIWQRSPSAWNWAQSHTPPSWHQPPLRQPQYSGKVVNKLQFMRMPTVLRCFMCTMFPLIGSVFTWRGISSCVVVQNAAWCGTLRQQWSVRLWKTKRHLMYFIHIILKLCQDQWKKSVIQFVNPCC